MVKNTILLIVLFSLCSCAITNQSPYQRESSTQGYSEKKLSPTSYSIYFKGNYVTEQQRTNDFALLRAAELTLDNGYHHLKVIFNENTFNEKRIIYSQPMIIRETHTFYTVNNVKVCVINKKGRYNSEFQEYRIVSSQMENIHKGKHRDTYYNTSIEYIEKERILKKPVSEIHVQFVSENHKNDVSVVTANEIINRITKKYRIKLNAI